MRPTRWTRKHRMTYYGKGGWSVGRWGFSYTNPVTGDGVFAGWRLRTVLRMRRYQEQRRREQYQSWGLLWPPWV